MCETCIIIVSIVNLYNYQPVPSEGSSISWNEFGFTKQCMGGNVVLRVSVNSLTSTAIAQFSTDGGVNWANANVGNNGFSYTRLPGSGTQEILARASDDHSHVITTYREISCGAPIPFGWGNNVVLSTGDSNVCRYDLQVVGLSTGGVAQFSIDNFASFYTATAPDIEKATYYLLKAPSTQQFWARDSNNPSNVITVTLNVCQP